MRSVVRPRRQRGVALITVLLVFALVAVIATNILQRSQLNLRSVGGLIETRQTYYYALAGEAYARQILAADIVQRRSVTDTLLEPWAQTKEQQPFELDNGMLQVEIHDLQGRFNLNNIATDPVAVAEFRKLLTSLQLNVNYANALLDWLDTDQVVTPAGAEDADYSGYLTANALEADVSALRLLHSMQPEDYAKLAPHVTVLPEKSRTPLNINTAAVEVLSTIMSSPQAAQVVARQQSGGYNNVADLPVQPSLSTDIAGVSSNYFEVVVTVNYANRWQRIRTVLQRTRNQGSVTFKVLSRVRSPLIDDSE